MTGLQSSRRADTADRRYEYEAVNANMIVCHVIGLQPLKEDRHCGP
jgi:hypothetical protein